MQCARGLLSSSDQGIPSNFDGNSSVFVVESPFLVTALGSCQDALGDPGHPLEFPQVTWCSFIVAVRPPLELCGAAPP